MDVGAPELLIILAVVLLLFGGAKLPDLARGLGRAKKEFEAGARGDRPDDPDGTGDTRATGEDPPPST